MYCLGCSHLLWELRVFYRQIQLGKTLISMRERERENEPHVDILIVNPIYTYLHGSSHHTRQSEACRETCRWCTTSESTTHEKLDLSTPQMCFWSTFLWSQTGVSRCQPWLHGGARETSRAWRTSGWCRRQCGTPWSRLQG